MILVLITNIFAYVWVQLRSARLQGLGFDANQFIEPDNEWTQWEKRFEDNATHHQGT